MREDIINFHDLATKNGAKIVRACGNDSIPSDMCTWLAAKTLWEQCGARVGRVDGLFMDGYGGFSGGTVASLMHIEEMGGEQKAKSLKPYGLNIGEESEGGWKVVCIVAMNNVSHCQL